MEDKSARTAFENQSLSGLGERIEGTRNQRQEQHKKYGEVLISDEKGMVLTPKDQEREVQHNLVHNGRASDETGTKV